MASSEHATSSEHYTPTVLSNPSRKSVSAERISMAERIKAAELSKISEEKETEERTDRSGGKGSKSGLEESSSQASSSIKMDPTQSLHSQKVSQKVSKKVSEEILQEDARPIFVAKHIVQLLVPITCSMTLVVLYSNFVLHQPGSVRYEQYMPSILREEQGTGWIAVWKSVLIAGSIVVSCAFITFFLFFAFYKRWYKVISGLMVLVSFTVLSFFTYSTILSIFLVYRFTGNCLSLALFMFNFTTMGMISLFWKAPRIIQQIYLVIISALVSTVFLRVLPDWAVWTVLLVMSVWDLIAVLSPFGPLQMLIRLIGERDEQMMPVVVYTAGMVYLSEKDSVASSSTQRNTEVSNRSEAQLEHESLLAHSDERSTAGSDVDPDSDKDLGSGRFDECETSAVHKDERLKKPSKTETRTISNERRETSQGTKINDANKSNEDASMDVKLGLGDFIFYGVLIGRASRGGILTTASCFIAILTGFVGTVAFLMVRRRALPALPMSIFMGICAFFATSHFINPFCAQISLHHLVI